MPVNSKVVRGRRVGVAVLVGGRVTECVRVLVLVGLGVEVGTSVAGGVNVSVGVGEES